MAFGGNCNSRGRKKRVAFVSIFRKFLLFLPIFTIFLFNDGISAFPVENWKMFPYIDRSGGNPWENTAKQSAAIQKNHRETALCRFPVIRSVPKAVREKMLCKFKKNGLNASRRQTRILPFHLEKNGYTGAWCFFPQAGNGFCHEGWLSSAEDVGSAAVSSSRVTRISSTRRRTVFVTCTS